jgi:hypothetical protein
VQKLMHLRQQHVVISSNDKGAISALNATHSALEVISLLDLTLNAVKGVIKLSHVCP